jgi:hypothetical protein
MVVSEIDLAPRFGWFGQWQPCHFEPAASVGRISTQSALTGRNRPGAMSGKLFLPTLIFCMAACGYHCDVGSVVKKRCAKEPSPPTPCRRGFPPRPSTSRPTDKAGFSARMHWAPSGWAQVVRLRGLPVIGTISRRILQRLDRAGASKENRVDLRMRRQQAGNARLFRLRRIVAVEIADHFDARVFQDGVFEAALRLEHRAQSGSGFCHDDAA